MFLPSIDELDYECICIMINDKTCSVPLNILSSVDRTKVVVSKEGVYISKTN